MLGENVQMIIVGNKTDMQQQRQVLATQAQEFVVYLKINILYSFLPLDTHAVLMHCIVKRRQS
jgi:hypothetical protein